jgi:hypothetical protein
MICVDDVIPLIHDQAIELASEALDGEMIGLWLLQFSKMMASTFKCRSAPLDCSENDVSLLGHFLVHKYPIFNGNFYIRLLWPHWGSIQTKREYI